LVVAHENVGLGVNVKITPEQFAPAAISFYGINSPASFSLLDNGVVFDVTQQMVSSR
jgi:hypothetical protein